MGPTILGVVSLSLVVAGSTSPGSPFSTHLPDAWFFGVARYAGSHAGLLGVAAFWVGLVGLCRAWWELCRRLRSHPMSSPARVMLIAALWSVPLLVGPPLLSRDVYSYAAQGKLMSLGLNPYHVGVGALAGQGFLHLVSRIWHWTPAPYGPVFLLLADMSVGLGGHQPLGSVLVMRLVALGGVCLIAWGVLRIARSHGRDPALAGALVVCNPITLLGLVSGAHNDALMIGLGVAGVALALEGRYLAGIAVASVGAAVKVPVLLVVVFLGWHWLGSGTDWRQRLRSLAVALAVSAAILEASAKLVGVGWGWVGALGTPGLTSSPFTPSQILPSLLGAPHALLSYWPSPGDLLPVTRAAGLALAALICLWLFWRSTSLGMVKCLGLSFLAVVVLAPVIQVWYFSWPLCLLGPIVVGGSRRLLLASSVAATFMWLPNSWYVLSTAGKLGLVAAVVCCAGLAILWRPGLDRLRTARSW